MKYNGLLRKSKDLYQNLVMPILRFQTDILQESMIICACYRLDIALVLHGP